MVLTDFLAAALKIELKLYVKRREWAKCMEVWNVTSFNTSAVSDWSTKGMKCKETVGLKDSALC